MYSCSPTTTTSKRKPNLGGSIHLGGYFLVVACVAIRIHSILIRFHREVSFWQERKIDFQITRRPIGHGSHIPVSAISSGDNHVVRDAGIEHFRFVPLGWNRNEKIHDFGLTHVV